MLSARPVTALAVTFAAMLVAVPALAEVRPVAVTSVTQAPAQTVAVTVPPASGEVRDIVQTAFFQALTTPAPAAPR